MPTLTTTRMLAAAALAGAGLLAPPAALALAAAAPQTTYHFSGVCTDCTLDSPPSIGTLVLQGYSPGDLIQAGNFVSFTYNGSNLVFPFTVNAADLSPFPGSADVLTGAMPAVGGAAAFRVVFQDGIGFESTTAGDWFACAPGPAGYNSGSCNLLRHNDVGTGTWSTTAVPEPASFVLMGLGILGGAGLRRLRAAR